LHLKAFCEKQASDKSYLEKTVNRINNITMGMAGPSRMSKILRNQIGILKFGFPFIMPHVRNFVMRIN